MCELSFREGLWRTRSNAVSASFLRMRLGRFPLTLLYDKFATRDDHGFRVWLLFDTLSIYYPSHITYKCHLSLGVHGER